MSRLERLLSPKGRCLLVALDHLSRPGRPVLTPPQPLVDAAAAGGADGVILRPGAARRCALGRLALVLSVGPDPGPQSVELGLRLDAAALKLEAFPGAPGSDGVVAMRDLCQHASRWDLPVLGEMIPVGFGAPETRDTARVAAAGRLGADLGAEVLKLPLTPDYERVASYAQAPVLVLGGTPGEPMALLRSLRAALDGGAAGAAVGRAVWQHPKPERMVRALAALIHQDASPEQAAAQLG